MGIQRITDAELWERVRQASESEWIVRQPELLQFRAAPDEIENRKTEDAEKAAEAKRIMAGDPSIADALRLGYDLARCGRETVRFERWRYPSIYPAKTI